MALAPRLRPLARALALAVALVVGLGAARGDELPAAVQRWMHAEQKLLSRDVNEQRISTPHDNKQRREFTPEAGQTFAVKSYWLPAASAHAFAGSGIEPGMERLMTRTRGGQRQVRLLVHPESEGFYRDFLRDSGAVRGEDFRAQATASSRTLLVWRDGGARDAFFAKLSLDAEIGGVTRTITHREIARSIGVSNVLTGDARALPDSFGFLPEVYGVMPRGMERGGMIIRAIPPEVRRGEVKLVPLFSLYAEPAGGGRPLLVDMIRKSGQDPRRFVEQRIIAPFARQWAELALEHGITSEPHAQNVLLELGRDGLPTGRFFHRDFGGFNVDFEHRRAVGRPVPRDLPVITGLREDYFVDKHVASLDHLEIYFGQGFVYNLDQKLPRWQKKGWLKRPARERLLGATSFMELLRRHTEKAFGEVSGARVTLRTLADLPAATHEARRGVLAGKAPPRGERAPAAGARPGWLARMKASLGGGRVRTAAPARTGARPTAQRPKRR
jgi:hypothetical protein